MRSQKEGPTARDGQALDSLRQWFGATSRDTRNRESEQGHGEEKCAILHANSGADPGTQVIEASREKGPSGEELGVAPSSVVIHAPLRRTADRRGLGLTVPETRRLHKAGRFILSRGWHAASVTVAGHHLPEPAFRELLRQVKSRIADCQRRAGMPAFSVEVIETTESVHAHIIVATNAKARKAIERLPASAKFSAYDDGGNTFLDVRRVTDMEGALDYASKEMTPWAGQLYPHIRRAKAPARKGLGDRVRLSRDLETALIAAGELQPFRRTYRDRKIGKSNVPIVVQTETVRDDEASPIAATTESLSPPNHGSDNNEDRQDERRELVRTDDERDGGEQGGDHGAAPNGLCTLWQTRTLHRTNQEHSICRYDDPAVRITAGRSNRTDSRAGPKSTSAQNHRDFIAVHHGRTLSKPAYWYILLARTDRASPWQHREKTTSPLGRGMKKAPRRG